MSLAFQNWGSTIFWLHHFLSPCCHLFLKPTSLFIRQRCSLLFGKNSLIRQTPLIRYLYSVYLFILASFEILLFAFRMLNDTSHGSDAFDKTFNFAKKKKKSRIPKLESIQRFHTDHLSYMFMFMTDDDSMLMFVPCTSGQAVHVVLTCFCTFSVFVMLNCVTIF